MTESKHRKLRKDEIDEWFSSEVTKQLFAHLDVDFDTLLQGRIEGGFFHPGEPFKTQENFSRSIGREEILQDLRDKQKVYDSLSTGFKEEDDE